MTAGSLDPVHPSARLDRATAGALVYDDLGVRFDGPAIADRIRRVGTWLTRRVGPHGRIGVIQDTHPDFQFAVLGGWWAGCTVLSLPGPVGDPGDYISVLTQLGRDGGLDAVIAPPPLHAAVTAAGLQVLAIPAELPTARGDAVAAEEFVHCTSGSTGRPRGVCLQLDRLGVHLDALASTLDYQSGMTAMSWLPLSHDMGFVGAFLSVLVFVVEHGGEVHLSAPSTYVRNPSGWLAGLAAASGPVLTVAPDTSWAVAARQLESRPEPLDLRGVRWIINGGEAVRTRTLDRLVAAGVRHGLNPSAVIPAYGMAEIGLAVSLATGAARRWVVDPDDLAAGVILPARADTGGIEIVSCGPPLPGIDVQAGEHGAVGALRVASDQLFIGYLGGEDRSGSWWETPDLGFVDADGQVGVIGRADDVIIVGGLKYHPDILEAPVRSRDDVRSGAVAAVAAPDGDGWWLVAVPRGTPTPARAVALRRAVTEVGLPAPRRVEFVAPEAFAKTPSGKPRRHRIAAFVGESVH